MLKIRTRRGFMIVAFPQYRFYTSGYDISVYDRKGRRVGMFATEAEAAEFLKDSFGRQRSENLKMRYEIVVEGKFEGLAQGIGFIKTRKAPAKVIAMEAELEAEASCHGIKIVNIITDSSSGVDIDRFSIDNLVEWMEKDHIGAVIVNDIYELTKDESDLIEFLLMADDLDVKVVSIRMGFQIARVVSKEEVH